MHKSSNKLNKNILRKKIFFKTFSLTCIHSMKVKVSNIFYKKWKKYQKKKKYFLKLASIIVYELQALEGFHLKHLILNVFIKKSI